MFVLRVSLVLLGIASFARGAEIQLLNNSKLQGQVVAIDGKGVTFKATGGGEKVYNNNEIVAIDLGPAAKELSTVKYTAVELVDGSVFHCSDFKIKGNQANITLYAPDGKGRQLQIPTTAIFTMLREANETLNTLDFKKTLNGLRGQRRDIYVFARGEGVNRKLTGLVGTFGEGTIDAEMGNKLKFTDNNGMEQNLFQDRVHGMMYSQIPNANPPPAICRVVDTFKNTLVAQSISLKEKKLVVKTVSGLDIEIPSIDGISRIDYSTASLRYLSELQPANITKTDTSESPFTAPRFDKNLDDEKLRINGVTYDKGVSIHAGYALSWNIGGDYRVLKGLLGVDDAFEIPSAVKVTIEADGREVFSKVVKKKDKPLEVNLDVTNIKLIRVIVVSADPNGFDSENQVNFVDAKVTK